ncbi:MAG TPA: ATP-binding protein [Candidatus Cloacimonadota bacterium]|nr:ATP-binding protein [Candidatus Cloacimonadota bacterium]HPT71195.1 ATP-binding protein [Candidatus Cloacimonadota bacterium]
MQFLNLDSSELLMQLLGICVLILLLLVIVILYRKNARNTSDLDLQDALRNQLLDELGIGVLKISPELKVKSWNSNMISWFPNLVKGQQTLSMKLNPADKNNSMDNSPSVAAVLDHKIHSGFYRVQMATETRHFQVYAIPVMNQVGRSRFLLEIWQDISEIHKLRQQADQSRKMEIVGQLACGIAHDFNNILQVINGHTEMLLQFHEQDEALQRSLNIILTSGQRASALTRQLLLFSRKQEVETKAMNVNMVVENMHKMLSRLLGEDISLELLLAENAWAIKGDETQIEQMIMNLSINARDAMPKGGKIKISTTNVTVREGEFPNIEEAYPGNFLTISVSDTGTGISEDIKDRIFEPFFTTKIKGEGTGLGLATVFSLLRSHDGFIRLDTKVGRGTTFYLYYPAFQENLMDESPAQENEEKVLSNGERILLVEDDDQVGQFACEALTHYRFQVFRAANLEEAWLMLKNEDAGFDLVLSDYILPDGTGGEFLKDLQERGYQMPVILSSGYSEERTKIFSLENQDFTFLAKPYSLSELIDTCRKVLNKDGA